MKVVNLTRDGEFPKYFPKWNEWPDYSRRSTISLTHCNKDILPAHDLGINVYNKPGGGFNHRQDHIFFAKQPNCDGPLIISWPIIPPSISKLLLISCFAILLWLFKSIYSSLLATKLTKYDIYIASLPKWSAYFILLYYLITALLNLPATPFISPDSTTWVTANPIINPYFSWLLNSFEWLDRISNKPGMGYQLFILMSYYLG